MQPTKGNDPGDNYRKEKDTNEKAKYVQCDVPLDN